MERARPTAPTQSSPVSRYVPIPRDGTFTPFMFWCSTVTSSATYPSNGSTAGSGHPGTLPNRPARPGGRVAAIGVEQMPVGPDLRHRGLHGRAAPGEGCRTGGAPEELHEVARVVVADAPAYLIDREVGPDEEAPPLRHAALGDPLHDRPPGLAPDHRGEVARREADGPRHVLEREAPAVEIRL